MSKITASADIQQVDAKDVQKYIDLFCQDVLETVNGKLDFQNNFACKILSVAFATANTQVAVSHGLGRVPQGYIQVSATVASNVYNGATANSSTTLYLMASVASTIGLVVF